MSTRKEVDVPRSHEAQQVLDLLKRVCDDIHGACKAVLKTYHKKLEKEGILLKNPAETGKNSKSSHDKTTQDDPKQGAETNKSSDVSETRPVQVLIRELFDGYPLPVTLKAIALEVVEKQLVQELSHEVMVANGHVDQRKRTLWPVVAPYSYVPPMNYMEFPNGMPPNPDMPPVQYSVPTVGLPVMNKLPPPVQVSNAPEPSSQIVQCVDNPIYDFGAVSTGNVGNIGAPVLPPLNAVPPPSETFQLASVTNEMPTDQSKCPYNESKIIDHCAGDHNPQNNSQVPVDPISSVPEVNSSVEKASSSVKEAADSLSEVSHMDVVNTIPTKESTEKQTKNSQTSSRSKEKSSSHSSKSHHKHSSSKHSSKAKFDFEGFRIKSEKSSDHSDKYSDFVTEKKKNLKEKLNILKEQLKLSTKKSDQQKITKESLLEKFQKGVGSSTYNKPDEKERNKEKNRKSEESKNKTYQDEDESELVGSTTIDLPILSFKKNPRDPRSAKPCKWDSSKEESEKSTKSSSKSSKFTLIPKSKYKVTPFQLDSRKGTHDSPPPFNSSGFFSGPCGRHCATCCYMLPTNIIKSNNQDIVRLKDTIDCNTSNLIYAVYCMRCDKALCVNVTSQALKSRLQTQISAAKTSKGDSLSLHFNSGEHTLRDFAAVGLETNRNKDREEHWITLLCTWRPYGLNMRARSSTPDPRKADSRSTRSTTAPPESRTRPASPEPYVRHKRFKHM